jgi:hypothetical protein
VCRLYDALVAHFGSDLVFIDIDSIRAGQNFADVIDKRIAPCSVVFVLIGKGWLKSVDDQGHRRLDDPHDFVRLEIASALAQQIPVIPVLVGDAKMPRLGNTRFRVRLGFGWSPLFCRSPSWIAGIISNGDPCLHSNQVVINRFLLYLPGDQFRVASAKVGQPTEFFRKS